jgi:acetyltransferase-like isoleucine patch superfamily enzyme
VKVSSYSWIGSGNKIGRNSSIGSHVVLGDDITLEKNSVVGNHVLIEKAGYWSGTWESGTMLESDFRAPAKLIGVGYTFTRSQKT